MCIYVYVCLYMSLYRLNLIVLLYYDGRSTTSCTTTIVVQHYVLYYDLNYGVQVLFLLNLIRMKFEIDIKPI